MWYQGRAYIPQLECKNIQLRTILLVTLPDLYCGSHI